MLDLADSRKIHCNDCECRYSEAHQNHPVCPCCGGTNTVLQLKHHWSHDEINISYKAVQPLPQLTPKGALNAKIK